MIEPNCIGLSELFDSRDLADHAIAATYCRTCPVIDQCALRLLEAQRAATGGPDGGPQGTWAGRFIGEPWGRKRREPRDGRGRWRHVGQAS